MNIPPEVARAQAHHGAKGAVHGSKGGRPRLALTDDERKEHRRKQQEAWRRRNGIPPKKVRPPRKGPTNWLAEYVSIWGKLPDIPLTPEEFAAGELKWNARVEAQQEQARLWELEKQQRRLERKQRRDQAPPTPSVGRNQPCPCGSGRKFKKCCG